MSPQTSSKGLEYIVVELGKGNWWDFPMQQDSHKNLLIGKNILQDMRTLDTTTDMSLNLESSYAKARNLVGTEVETRLKPSNL